MVQTSICTHSIYHPRQHYFPSLPRIPHSSHFCLDYTEHASHRQGQSSTPGYLASGFLKLTVPAVKIVTVLPLSKSSPWLPLLISLAASHIAVTSHPARRHLGRRSWLAPGLERECVNAGKGVMATGRVTDMVRVQNEMGHVRIALPLCSV